MEALARAGLVAKGISYGLVGALAVGVAVGVGGATTSREGALHRLAGSGLGKILLVLLALGLASYALWRFLEAIVSDEWLKRAGYVGRGAIYAALAFSAAKILAGSGTQASQSQKAHKATAVVLGWPGGTWLVGAAGVVIIGAGAWNLYRGLTRSFEDKWRQRSTWGGIAGVVGHVARCIVFVLIGCFAVKAAVTFDPKDAVGLDGALRKLADQTYGTFLLGLTAAGLVAYALYCFVDARYREVGSRDLRRIYHRHTTA